jgi:hypothetical protein
MAGTAPVVVDDSPWGASRSGLSPGKGKANERLEPGGSHEIAPLGPMRSGTYSVLREDRDVRGLVAEDGGVEAAEPGAKDARVHADEASADGAAGDRAPHTSADLDGYPRLEVLDAPEASPATQQGGGLTMGRGERRAASSHGAIVPWLRAVGNRGATQALRGLNCLRRIVPWRCPIGRILVASASPSFPDAGLSAAR